MNRDCVNDKKYENKHTNINVFLTKKSNKKV